MTPTGVPSKAPAQKQKVCQPRAHAVPERLDNSRKIADRRNKSPTAHDNRRKQHRPPGHQQKRRRQTKHTTSNKTKRTQTRKTRAALEASTRSQTQAQQIAEQRK
eukprot:5872918-Prymnesium_polylepis.1